MDLPALLGYTGSFARGALHHSLREGEKFRKWKGHHLFFQKGLQKKCHFQDLLLPKKSSGCWMSWMFRMLDEFYFSIFGGAQQNAKSTPSTKSVFFQTFFVAPYNQRKNQNSTSWRNDHIHWCFPLSQFHGNLKSIPPSTPCKKYGFIKGFLGDSCV